MNNVSNSGNNTTNNTNHSNSNPIIQPSLLSVALSTAQEYATRYAMSSSTTNTTVDNTANITGLPPLQWNNNPTNPTNNANTTNINSQNLSSFYTVDSTIKDLMGNLNINAANNLTSDDIDDKAFKYVQDSRGLLRSTYQPLYQGLQSRLARLFGYPLNQTTLPHTLCTFLQNINCVMPFQIINKFGGG